MILSYRVAIAFFFVLLASSQAFAGAFDHLPECKTVVLPTDDQIRGMSAAQLFPWYQNAKHAQSTLAKANAAGVTVDPCITVLASKGYTIIDEAMKYAY
jgi:hypothetical protein